MFTHVIYYACKQNSNEILGKLFEFVEMPKRLDHTG